MRVLRQPHQAVEFESDCDECETRVALTADDLRYEPDQRDGDAVRWLCPTCHHYQWIAADLVPREIVDKVEWLQPRTKRRPPPRPLGAVKA
jgi:hypothetical protein